MEDFQDFQIQSGQLGSGKKIFGVAWDDPLLSLVAYPRQTGNKNRDWWTIPCRKPSSALFFLSRGVLCTGQSPSGLGLQRGLSLGMHLANGTAADKQPSHLGADAC